MVSAIFQYSFSNLNHFFIVSSRSIGMNLFLGGRHKYLSTCGKYIYHLALIDYLQEFNLEKKGESTFKIWILRRP